MTTKRRLANVTVLIAIIAGGPSCSQLKPDEGPPPMLDGGSNDDRGAADGHFDENAPVDADDEVACASDGDSPSCGPTRDGGGDAARDADAAMVADADAAGDAAGDADQDCASTHAAGDPCAPPRTYFVRAGAVGLADGSFEHPYKTITAALRAARNSSDAVRIDVGEGRYDAALGEVFPLVLRGAIAVEGAGASKTIVVGTGLYDARLAGGAYNSLVDTTFVLGDDGLTTQLSGLAILPVSVGSEGTVGVFCDRGNAADAGITPIAPNSKLARLKIGPGFDTGILATTSTIPTSSGCNLSLVESDISNASTGLWALGCNGRFSVAKRVPVALVLGDGTVAGGNSFAHITQPGNDGAGIHLSGCVTSVSATFNHFALSNAGVSIEQSLAGVTPFGATFKSNVFENLTNYGILVTGDATIINDLDDNLFTGISTANVLAGYPGAALILQTGAGTTYPRFGKARNNRFVGNDIGVFYRIGQATQGGFDPGDFGTTSDPGGNVFLCNSTPSFSSLPGGDVIAVLIPIAPTSFPFEGNTWDHAPPTNSPYGSQPNGSDVSTELGQPLTVNVNGAILSSEACPAGRLR